jgi:hypothetical protein
MVVCGHCQGEHRRDRCPTFIKDTPALSRGALLMLLSLDPGAPTQRRLVASQLCAIVDGLHILTPRGVALAWTELARRLYPAVGSLPIPDYRALSDQERAEMETLRKTRLHGLRLEARAALNGAPQARRGSPSNLGRALFEGELAAALAEQTTKEGT